MTEMLGEFQETRAKLDMLFKALEMRGIGVTPAEEHDFKGECFLEAEKETEYIKEAIEKIGLES